MQPIALICSVSLICFGSGAQQSTPSPRQQQTQSAPVASQQQAPTAQPQQPPVEPKQPQPPAAMAAGPAGPQRVTELPVSNGSQSTSGDLNALHLIPAPKEVER